MPSIYRLFFLVWVFTCFASLADLPARTPRFGVHTRLFLQLDSLGSLRTSELSAIRITLQTPSPHFPGNTTVGDRVNRAGDLQNVGTTAEAIFRQNEAALNRAEAHLDGQQQRLDSLREEAPATTWGRDFLRQIDSAQLQLNRDRERLQAERLLNRLNGQQSLATIEVGNRMIDTLTAGCRGDCTGGGGAFGLAGLAGLAGFSGLAASIGGSTPPPSASPLSGPTYNINEETKEKNRYALELAKLEEAKQSRESDANLKLVLAQIQDQNKARDRQYEERRRQEEKFEKLKADAIAKAEANKKTAKNDPNAITEDDCILDPKIPQCKKFRDTRKRLVKVTRKKNVAQPKPKVKLLRGFMSSTQSDIEFFPTSMHTPR